MRVSFIVLVALTAVACGGRATLDEGGGPAGASTRTTMGQSSTSGPSSGAPETCTPVLASNYDQYCTVDSDCVLVGEYDCTGCSCPTQVVNVSAAAIYTAAVRAAFAAHPSSLAAGCSCEDNGGCGPTCVGGKCQANSPPPCDSLSSSSSSPAVDAAPAPPDANPPSDAGALLDSGWCSPIYGPVAADQADASAATACDGFCLPLPTYAAAPPAYYGCQPTQVGDCTFICTETAAGPECAETCGGQSIAPPDDAGALDAAPSDASACPGGMTACKGCFGTTCIDAGSVCVQPPCPSPPPPDPQ